MKKLTAILKGRNFVDKLFSIREREVKRNIEAAKDSVESEKAKAELEYEKLCYSLAGDNVDYNEVINCMIQCKETISNADATLTAIAAIEEDLKSDVKEEDTDKA